MNRFNKAEWHSMGYVPKPGEKPREIVYHGKGRESHLFDEDQVRPLLKRQKPQPATLEPTADNVLAACWTVNRTAKRYRDAASSCYSSGVHSFAGSNRRKKEECYARKDKALKWLIHHGAVQCCGLSGVLAVWRGGGYTFHALLGPCEAEQIGDEQESVFVEAKRKGAAELRLMDAEALIDGLPSHDIPGTITRSFPQRARCRRYYDDEEWSDWRDEDGEW